LLAFAGKKNPMRIDLLRSVVLLFSLIFGGSALAQTTVTLMQGVNGYAGTTDAWLWGATDTNRGTDELPMRSEDLDSAVLRFSIFQSEGGPVPNGATITSAMLSLYKWNGPDMVVKASRLLKSWNESQVTWFHTATGVTWTSPGANGSGTDYVATADGQGSIGNAATDGCNTTGPFPDACWLNINVTSGVQVFAANPASNFGWKLAQMSSSLPGNYKNFNSKEINNFPTLRPKLTITYDGTPPCTPPTASFTATPSSGTAPLGVIFDASASTDGSSPITSLRLQFGDGTPDATWSSKTQTQSHTYNLPNGQKTATLTATSACGPSAPVTRTITVGGPTPTASLVADRTSGTAPLTVTFDASGSADNGSAITNLRLQYGDGTESNWTNKSLPQTHTYTAEGPKTATLIVTNANGDSSPATQTINVGPGGGGGACIPSGLTTKTGVAIPTFHSMSLYYNPSPAPSGDKIFMRYRKGSDDPNLAASWKQGHELWYDTRNLHTYHARGSAVHLTPGTPYVFEVSRDGVTWDASILGMAGASDPCPSTWSETDQLPIGTTLHPFTGTKTTLTTSHYLGSRSGETRQHVLLADQSGTASGYTLYDFTGANAGVAQTIQFDANGNPINDPTETYPVVISGSYIILRGLKTVGGASGIFIDPGSHDVLIDGVEITYYGRDADAKGNCARTLLGSGLSGTRACNEDSGIKFPDASFGPILDTKRIVVQRSSIHNPAFGSNPWDSDHPVGTGAITMYPTGGQIVIRYNRVYSTTDGQFGGPADLSHFHLDGLILGGCNNLSSQCTSQGIGPDVDIYKNIVMHYFDDGLETDGDGVNDRVWKNYFDYGGATAISTTPTYIGPVYNWRNVYNRARMRITQPWGNESDRGDMFKSGAIGQFNGGKRYLYHNTSLQPTPASEGAPGPSGLGAARGSARSSATDAMLNTTALNNVFELWKPDTETYRLIGASGDLLDFDLTNSNCWGSTSTTSCNFVEAHGARATPLYQPGNGFSSYWNGKYRLSAGTPGHDDGTVIPNFSDGFVGSAPDRGAHEDGTSDMDFGPGASGS
jgi:PKD repeat protein